MNLEKEKEKAFILKRAKAAVISRDFTLAARLYKSLLKEDAANIGLLSALGSLYVKAGNDRKALMYYEQIRTLSPNNFEALNSMGGIYRRLQKYSESINVLQQALELGLNDTQVNYNLGFTYRSMGAYDEAIECFESVIDENPNDVLAYNHLGAIYALRKDDKKAVTVYKRGLQIDPNHPILQLNLAGSYESLHDDREAASAYEAALRAKPGWIEAIRGYTKLLMRHHKTKDAADLVRKSILLYPDDAGLLNLLGHIYLKQYDFPSAAQTFEKARLLDGGDTEVLSGLAEAYEKSSRIRDAAEVLQESERIRPDDAAVARQYAHVLLTGDDCETASQKIKKAYVKDKNDVRTLDLYGQYYICRNEDEKAERVYGKIAKLDPSYEDYKKEAAARFRQKGRFDKARRVIQQYLAKHPDNAEELIALALLEEAGGNMEAALEAYHRALKYDQYNVFARNEVRRIGDLINDANRRRDEPEQEPENEDSSLEIVMDAPPEEQPDGASGSIRQPDADEDEFDFDMMGDSLLKDDDDDDPFAVTDAEDDDDGEEKPQGLDQLVPADQPIDQLVKPEDEAEQSKDPFGGFTGPAEEPDPAVQEKNTDGFGSENIDEEPERRHPVPETAEQDEASGTPPAYGIEPDEPASADDRLLSAGEPNDMQEPDVPAPVETYPQETAPEDTLYEDPAALEQPHRLPDTPRREAQRFSDQNHMPGERYSGQDAPVPPRSAGDGDTLDRLAAALNRTNTANDFAASAAQSSAERAWYAAQRAADSAQSAGAAVERIEQIAEETARKAAEEAALKTAEESVQSAFKTAENSGGETDTSVQPDDRTEAGDGQPLSGTESGGDGGENEEQEEEGGTDGESVSACDDMIDKAVELLPGIITRLEKNESPDNFITELELFRNLRMLCEYLPPEKKEKFMASRTRLLLDYVIARLSGLPGLIATADELRKTEALSGMFSAEENVQQSGTGTRKDDARVVIASMRNLLQDLPDAYLAKALDDCAAEALRTI